MDYKPEIIVFFGFICLISLFIFDIVLCFPFLSLNSIDREDEEVHSIAITALGIALILCLTAIP